MIKKDFDTLQRYAHELERSNRELDEFAYIISHDLKAPLRAINSLSKWIEEDLPQPLNEECTRHIQMLRSNVKRMEDMIDGVLKYSRLGRIEEARELFSFKEMVNQIFEMIHPPREISLVYEGDVDMVEAEKGKVQQVVANLISNAVRYHDSEKGVITISAGKDDEYYHFSVADDGPGIAPEYHERVFQIFQRLSPEKSEGSGIGLAIVKKIVEKSGGKISLSSEKGKGTLFTVLWPCNSEVV